MIKIITPGIKKYKKKCVYCGCVFTFDETDVTDHQVNWGVAESIRCPFCNNELRVDKTDINIGPTDEYEFPPQTVEAISGVSPV